MIVRPTFDTCHWIALNGCSDTRWPLQGQLSHTKDGVVDWLQSTKVKLYGFMNEYVNVNEIIFFHS